MANLIGFLILLVFLWGRSQHAKNTGLHVRVMLSVIAADISLVLYLVFVQHALDKVNLGMPWTLKVHIPIALTTVLLYLAMAWTGWRLYNGGNTRSIHYKLDKIIVPCRILTLATSLMVEFIKA